MEQTNITQSSTLKQGFNWSDYFSFNKMITLRIIQIVYIVGAAVITLGGLMTVFTKSSGYGYGSMMPHGFFGGLMIILVGNVFWRMWCELIIVLFRINKTLSNIETNTNK